MIENKFKLQLFRTNDLIDDSGKQIEFGKSWIDFFGGIQSSQKNVTISIEFKILSNEYQNYNGEKFELILSEVTNRGDRKAYANDQNGMSKLKDFFVHKLHLTIENNNKDYFGLYKVGERECYLYFVPELLAKNLISLLQNGVTEITVERRSLSFEQNFSILQQIYYGAPGTGKSHRIKNITDKQPKENVFRTTFHPDSDYSTFVGCYKPTTNEVKQISGENVSINKTISYEFIAQAFTNAYVRSYQTDEPIYLVIEEINRGNCAQIFGDLFQLLDRNEAGVSDYAIKPDADLKKYLADVFKNSFLETKKSDPYYNEIISGEEMLLPSNLYIWATMNTSDQSLFPIDSAFKRRWDWKYIPIADANKGWKICFGEEYIKDWWEFIDNINKEIEKATKSEDKKLGYFFCKAVDGKIDADKFVSKVVFYLWNDVFKDYGFNSKIFKTTEGEKLSFHDFYNNDGSVCMNVVKEFIDRVVGKEDISKQTSNQE